MATEIVHSEATVSARRRAVKRGDFCGNPDCPCHRRGIPNDGRDVITVGEKVYCRETCYDKVTSGN